MNSNQQNEVATAEIAGEDEVDVTPAEMLDCMLSLGFSAEEIEAQMGASGYVKNALHDANPVPSDPSAHVLKLLDLYWREQLKGLFRRSPFIGAVKGAQEIGMKRSEFRRIYRLLIDEGKLKYRLTIPAWVGAKKVALRKHVVID